MCALDRRPQNLVEASRRADATRDEALAAVASVRVSPRLDVTCAFVDVFADAARVQGGADVMLVRVLMSLR